MVSIYVTPPFRLHILEEIVRQPNRVDGLVERLEHNNGDVFRQRLQHVLCQVAHGSEIGLRGVGEGVSSSQRKGYLRHLDILAQQEHVVLDRLLAGHLRDCLRHRIRDKGNRTHQRLDVLLRQNDASLQQRLAELLPDLRVTSRFLTHPRSDLLLDALVDRFAHEDGLEKCAAVVGGEERQRPRDRWRRRKGEVPPLEHEEENMVELAAELGVGRANESGLVADLQLDEVLVVGLASRGNLDGVRLVRRSQAIHHLLQST